LGQARSRRRSLRDADVVSQRMIWFQRCFAAGGAIVLLSGAVLLVSSRRLQPAACFTTSLSERSEQQLRNIRIAVNALDGRQIPRGARLSFNRIAGPYTAQRGYAKAPTIIRGHLQPAPAGGVCQVSSTLYNAALLAGMKIVERHPHASPVSSVPPGRDAMVASGRADLVWLNDSPEAARIEARISGERLVVCIVTRSRRKPDVTIRTERHRLGPGRFEVATLRITRKGRGGKIREIVEMIARDRYEPPASE